MTDSVPLLPEFIALNEPSANPKSLIAKITDEVNHAVVQKEPSEKIEGLLWRTWNAVIATASKTAPEEQQNLVDVVKGLSTQPVLKGEDGQEVKIWDMTLWVDLPVFGAAIREAFNVGKHSKRNRIPGIYTK